MTNDFRELVAALAHEQWSGWMLFLFAKSEYRPDGSIIIPPDLVERWERQMNTDYSNLPEDEKESDRIEADRFIRLFSGDVVKITIAKELCKP